MTVPRTVADVLADHVTLEVECIDRMYLNVYQPRLQHVNGVVWFFRGHRGATFASSALMDPITKEFVGSIHRFCRDQDVPMVDFAKGSARTTSRTSTWPPPTAGKGCSSSDGRRRSGAGSCPASSWSSARRVSSMSRCTPASRRCTTPSPRS